MIKPFFFNDMYYFKVLFKKYTARKVITERSSAKNTLSGSRFFL